MEELVKESLELINRLGTYSLDNYLDEKVQKLKNNLDIILKTETEQNEFDLARERMVNSLVNVQHSIKNVIPLTEKASKEISYCDNAINDLLHAIEIIDCDDEKLLEYTIQIKKIRVRRRKAKDFLDVTSPLKKFRETTKNDGAISRICNLKQTVNDRNNHLNKKTYTVRVMKEMQNEFDELSKRKTLTNGQ